jgi:acetyl esterase/lipase
VTDHSGSFLNNLHLRVFVALQVGGAEMLHDQVVEFVAKVRGAGGGPVDLQVAAEMPHVFQLFAFVNEMPQVRACVDV